MATCDYCGADVDTPFNCNYCERDYCPDHRLPESHDCPYQATATSPAESEAVSKYSARVHHGDSGVEEPEPLDLSDRTKPKSELGGDDSPAVQTVDQSTKTDASSSQTKHTRTQSAATDEADSSGTSFETARIRASSTSRTAIRFVALCTVLVGMVNLLGPYVGFGRIVLYPPLGLIAVSETGVIALGDVVVIAAGAVTTWFV